MQPLASLRSGIQWCGWGRGWLASIHELRFRARPLLAINPNPVDVLSLLTLTLRLQRDAPTRSCRGPRHTIVGAVRPRGGGFCRSDSSVSLCRRKDAFVWHL